MPITLKDSPPSPKNVLKTPEKGEDEGSVSRLAQGAIYTLVGLLGGNAYVLSVHSIAVAASVLVISPIVLYVMQGILIAAAAALIFLTLQKALGPTSRALLYALATLLLITACCAINVGVMVAPMTPLISLCFTIAVLTLLFTASTITYLTYYKGDKL